jgi:hypothetical protein
MKINKLEQHFCAQPGEDMGIHASVRAVSALHTKKLQGTRFSVYLVVVAVVVMIVAVIVAVVVVQVIVMICALVVYKAVP